MQSVRITLLHPFVVGGIDMSGLVVFRRTPSRSFTGLKMPTLQKWTCVDGAIKGSSPDKILAKAWLGELSLDTLWW